MPVISWSQPAAITNPTPLSGVQLSATANVPGTFVYSPAAGTVLAAGTQTLSTTFTPTDTANYSNATATITIVVNPAVVATPCPPPGSQPGVGSGHLAVADWGNGRVLIFDAPFFTGECASVVLGQAEFDSSIWYGNAPNLLSGPLGLNVDAAGDLFVADYNNGRVVEYQPPFTNGMNASLELGVPSFSSGGDANDTNCYKNPPAMSLCMPADVTVDKGGDVWVADMWEGRIVEYKPPIETAMNASIAIGQPDMNHTADCDGIYSIFRDTTGAPTTTTASQFCKPTSTAFDANGNLWVVDGNGRVLEFAPPFATGMAASLEIGYAPSIGMNSPTPFAHTGPEGSCPKNALFCGVIGLTFDESGNLWVTDSGNNRVLEFTPPFSSGMLPSLVIGQPDFQTTGLYPAAANTLNDPQTVSFDANGDLMVGDALNSRILIFVPPFSNGMSASVAIGQPNMTSSPVHGCVTADAGGTTSNPSASTFCQPHGVIAF